MEVNAELQAEVARAAALATGRERARCQVIVENAADAAIADGTINTQMHAWLYELAGQIGDGANNPKLPVVGAITVEQQEVAAASIPVDANAHMPARDDEDPDGEFAAAQRVLSHQRARKGDVAYGDLLRD